jgi:hypothetical protein
MNFFFMTFPNDYNVMLFAGKISHETDNGLEVLKGDMRRYSYQVSHNDKGNEQVIFGLEI